MKFLYLVLSVLVSSGSGLNQTAGLQGNGTYKPLEYAEGEGRYYGYNSPSQPNNYNRNAAEKSYFRTWIGPNNYESTAAGYVQRANPVIERQTTHYVANQTPGESDIPRDPSEFYNDAEVLSYKMRYKGPQDNCPLAYSPPGRRFHTRFNLKYVPPMRGQCTEWADGRYFQLTGHSVDFIHGTVNATGWDVEARKAGWLVTPYPVVPSIMVIKNTVPGYSGTGHVAVVESVNGPKVCTSNWNFPAPMQLSMKVFDLRYWGFRGKVFFLSKPNHS